MGDIQIIIGPPGTGKTTYLMEIMEKEMGNGVEPEEIAFVSFTRKAAREAIERVAQRFRLGPDDFPHVRTIHSLAYAQIGATRGEMMEKSHFHELGDYIGLEFSDKFKSVVDGVLQETTSAIGDNYTYLDSFARARQISPQKAWELLGTYDLNWFEYERFTKALKEFKRDRCLMDFSDLLEAKHQPMKIKVAIIDEAQDLSTLQWRFALNIFSQAERIYIAGDDDQAIYTWSGADVNFFLNLPGEKKILSQSYRVPKSVHALANDIAHRIEYRIDKKYDPAPDEGSVEYHTSMDHLDFSKGNWLLLARNDYMLKWLAGVVKGHGYLYSYRDQSTINGDHLRAIDAWERYRKGGVLPPEEVLLVERFLPPETTKWPTGIWHESLEAIPLKDREFYISLLRNGERLTKKPRINISTIHGVKGGEADNVVLYSDMAVRTYEGMETNPDGEHRVWYVGATRAKKALHVITPQTRHAYEV